MHNKETNFVNILVYLFFNFFLPMCIYVIVWIIKNKCYILDVIFTFMKPKSFSHIIKYVFKCAIWILIAAKYSWKSWTFDL